MKSVKVVAPPSPEVVQAKAKAETVIINSTGLPSLEIAVKQWEANGISNEGDLHRVNDLLSVNAKGEQVIIDYWAPLKSLAHATHAHICAEEKTFTERFQSIRTRLTNLMRPFLQKQKQEAEERKRILEQEAAFLRKKTLQDANRLALQGNMALAEETRLAAATIVVPVISTEPVKLEGTKLRHPWKITAINLPALVQAVARGEAPIECLQANESFILSKAAEMCVPEPWAGVKVEQGLDFSVSRK